MKLWNKIKEPIVEGASTILVAIVDGLRDTVQELIADKKETILEEKEETGTVKETVANEKGKELS